MFGLKIVWSFCNPNITKEGVKHITNCTVLKD